MIGVSPAYYFSLRGTGFGPKDIREEFHSLSRTGYAGFQAELFDAAAAPAWSEAAIRDLNDESGAEGMMCTAFIAHFMGSSFASAAAMASFSVDGTVRLAIDAAAGIEGNAVFGLPLAALAGPGPSPAALRDALGSIAEAVKAAGLRLALELMPGNALGGSGAFLRLCREPSFEELGLVFDTGHFRAMGEDVGSLPELLGDRIVVTHLCDNDGLTNLSLCPGDGTIPFDRVAEGLAASGYRGSLDVEIVCPSGRVRGQYARAVAPMLQLEALITRPAAKARTTIRSTP